MMDLHKAMGLRFKSTPVPIPSGDATYDNEKFAQWLAEVAFVCDFVYRNPPKAPSKEFSDILILFHDTAIVIQMKSQTGAREIDLWLPKNLNAAAKQLRGSVRALEEERVTSFSNELLKVDVPFHRSRFRCLYGLILMAIPGGPVEYEDMIEPENALPVDTNVMSLADFGIACQRMSTAADLIVYLELRHALSERKRLRLNDESRTMEILSVELPTLLRFSSGTDPVKHGRSLQLFRMALSGRILDHPGFGESLLVDDMIARCHDADPEFSVGSDPLERLSVAETLGYLTRQRRIIMGRHMLERALAARDGSPKLFVHFQRPVGQLYMFLYTSMSRADRRELLAGLAWAAPHKYKCTKVLGVATEPVGPGRSYDFCLVEHRGSLDPRVVPHDVLALLPELSLDLFTGRDLENAGK